MRCDEVQPDLLDYSRGLLSHSESEDVKTHLADCPACAALLEDEVAFSRRLSEMPNEQPENDVWALIQGQIKPKRTNVFAWLQDAMTIKVRRMAAGVAVACIMLVSLYVGTMQPVSHPTHQSSNVVAKAVKWSDDPVGDNTDAVVDCIANM